MLTDCLLATPHMLTYCLLVASQMLTDCLLVAIQMFSELWPSLSPMYEGCLENRRNWEQLASSFTDPRDTEPDGS